MHLSKPSLAPGQAARSLLKPSPSSIRGSANRITKPAKKPPKKADALLDLCLADANISRDAELLDIIKQNARHCIANPAKRGYLTHHPSLYSWYRGPLYPLRTPDTPPTWRFLSSWMKAQIALLCLRQCRAESSYLQFQIHYHDDMLEDLRIEHTDLQTYLRDRLSRCLKDRFGFIPYYFFVIENRRSSGTNVPPHVHGAIQIAPAPLPTTHNGELTRAASRALKKHGREKAEMIWGSKRVREAIGVASGNDGRRRPEVGERSQNRNVWVHVPYRPLFNSASVDYAFKNVFKPSRLLGSRRFTITRSLNQEAQRLWRLITEGETAITQWPNGSPHR